MITELQAVESKILAIRGNGTFLPVLAFRVQGDKSGSIEQRLIGYGGYGASIILMLLQPSGPNGIPCTYDTYAWGYTVSANNWLNDDDIRAAHDYLEQHFDDLRSGTVLQVKNHQVTEVTDYDG